MSSFRSPFLFFATGLLFAMRARTFNYAQTTIFILYQVYFGVEMVNHSDERLVIYVVPGADERQHSFRRYRAVAAALLVSVAVLALAALR